MAFFSVEWFAPKGLVVEIGPTEFLNRITDDLAAEVRRRIVAGVDYQGEPLHQPKDAGSERNPHGRPMIRTGQLLASIASHVETAISTGWVRAEGVRAGTKTKTKQLKGRLVNVRRGHPELGKVRTGARTVTVQAPQREGEVVAILERPAKGRRAGGRPPMVILKATEETVQRIAEHHGGTLRVNLRANSIARGGI